MSHPTPSPNSTTQPDANSAEEVDNKPVGQTLHSSTQDKLRKEGNLPIDAAQLLGPAGEVKLQHNGEIYSLRRTRNGRLILTK